MAWEGRRRKRRPSTQGKSACRTRAPSPAVCKSCKRLNPQKEQTQRKVQRGPSLRERHKRRGDLSAKGKGRQGVARGGEESDPPTPPAGNRSISSIAKELCLWRASYYLCLYGRPTRRRTWFGEPVSYGPSKLCYTRQALAFCLPTPPWTRRAASTVCVERVCHAPTHAKGGHKQAHGRGGLPFVVAWLPRTVQQVVSRLRLRQRRESEIPNQPLWWTQETALAQDVVSKISIFCSSSPGLAHLQSDGVAPGRKATFCLVSHCIQTGAAKQVTFCGGDLCGFPRERKVVAVYVCLRLGCVTRLFTGVEALGTLGEMASG